MLHVWNGFKLKACGYIKSSEPKSLICLRGNLFRGNLHSFKFNMCN